MHRRCYLPVGRDPKRCGPLKPALERSPRRRLEEPLLSSLLLHFGETLTDGLRWQRQADPCRPGDPRTLTWDDLVPFSTSGCGPAKLCKPHHSLCSLPTWDFTQPTDNWQEEASARSSWVTRNRTQSFLQLCWKDAQPAAHRAHLQGAKAQPRLVYLRVREMGWALSFNIFKDAGLWWLWDHTSWPSRPPSLRQNHPPLTFPTFLDPPGPCMTEQQRSQQNFETLSNDVTPPKSRLLWFIIQFPETTHFSNLI